MKRFHYLLILYTIVLLFWTSFFYAQDDLIIEELISQEAVNIIEENLTEDNIEEINIFTASTQDYIYTWDNEQENLYDQEIYINNTQENIDIPIQENFDFQTKDSNSDQESIINLYSNNNPQLQISEIFRDWTDEWIEISNIWSEIFSWEIAISWAKSSIITIPIFTINPWQSLILWDTCQMLSDISYIWTSWLAMSISDSNPSNISIHYSWELLDYFTLDSNTISLYNNTNTSSEKIKINSDYYITWVNSERIFNVIGWYIANPWTTFSITDTWSNNTWSQTWEIQNTWNLLSDQIYITEVYFDWYNERLEITNLWTWEFTWNISIYWASSSPINLNAIYIQSWESIIISDGFWYFLNTWNIVNSTLNISDTSAISIFLYHSWQELDSFIISQSFVNDINNQKTSFEKIINSDSQLITTITSSDRTINVSSWYLANPRKVYYYTWDITDISTTSWENIFDLSWLTIPIDCTNINQSIFNITEIFAGDGQHSTFIELFALESFSWQVIFSGGLLTSVFSQNLDIQKWDRILISNGYQGLIQDDKIQLETSLSLQSNSWWLIAYGQNWQVLDIVYYYSTNNWLSSYFDWLYSSCARILNHNYHYSPGFDETLLSYFPQWLPVYIEKAVYIWWWGSCNCPNSNTNPDQTWNLNNPTNPIPNQFSGQIKIIYIEYDPVWSDTDNEFVVLQSLSNTDLNLDDFRFQVVGKTSKKTVRWDILYSLSTQSFTWNYQFPNTASCINLLYQDQILDTYCYSGSPNNSSNQEIIPDTNYNSESFGSIEIVYIEYDPEGGDTNNEYIILKLLSWDQINLSSYKLQITKDSKTTNKSISWIIYLWQDQTIRWNFAFPNSTNDWNPVQVSLISPSQEILSTYTYNPNLSKNIPPSWIYNVYSVLDGDTFRVRFNEKLISFRLLWVDAPESSSTRFGYAECFGIQSKEYLKNLINKKDVQIQYESGQLVDSYWRLLAYVFLDSENINQKLIQNWYAREYTHQWNIYQYQSAFNSSQSYASSNQLGLRSNNTCSWQRINALSGKIIQTWNISTWETPNVKIISILPNPKWSDKWNETITLLYQSNSWLQASSWNQIDLWIWFYLLIWTRKKYLTWNILVWETKTFTWDFAFPNSASCIKLYFLSNLIDNFCYDKPKDGTLFQENNWVLALVSTTDISILNKSKLQTIWSNLCLTYEWQIVHCKKIPSSKTSKKNQNKIWLYENYLDLLQEYLKQDRSILFYNTEIKNYFDLLNEAKKNISNWIYYINLDWETLQTSDIYQWYEKKYNLDSFEFTISTLKNNLLWNRVVERYKKLKEDYFKYLEVVH